MSFKIIYFTNKNILRINLSNIKRNNRYIIPYRHHYLFEKNILCSVYSNYIDELPITNYHSLYTGKIISKNDRLINYLHLYKSFPFNLNNCWLYVVELNNLEQ